MLPDFFSHLFTVQQTTSGPTETCVAPVDTSRDFFFFFFFSERAVWGVERYYAARLLFSSFHCSADHERDWPPCNKVVFRVGNQYAEYKKSGPLCSRFNVVNSSL